MPARRLHVPPETVDPPKPWPTLEAIAGQGRKYNFYHFETLGQTLHWLCHNRLTWPDNSINWKSVFSGKNMKPLNLRWMFWKTGPDGVWKGCHLYGSKLEVFTLDAFPQCNRNTILTRPHFRGVSEYSWLLQCQIPGDKNQFFLLDFFPHQAPSHSQE